MIALQIFDHKKFGKIRVVVIDGVAWYVARDVLAALGYSRKSLGNVGTTISHISEDWKARKRIASLKGKQDTWCLTREGLFHFLGRSDKPAAKPFQK